jgi:hypothetical protein
MVGVKFSLNFWSLLKVPEFCGTYKISDKMKHTHNLASPWVRFLSVMADLTLSYLLYSFLLSLDFFSSLYQKIFLLLVSSFTTGVEVFTGTLLLYCIYFFVRFYSSLFFSQTPGQAIFGIYSEGESIAKRWKAALRIFIEFCTSPVFFITDLGLLFGKRTFKEKLSASSLLFSNDRWRLILGSSFLALLFSLLYFAPLLTHQKYLSEIDIKEGKISPESITSKTNFNSFRLIPSNYFSLASFSSLGNEQIVIIPQYEKVRRESIYTFKPKVLFYDKKTSEFISFKRGTSFSWLEQIQEIKALHPFFSFYYPSLNKMTKKEDLFKKINYEGESREKVFSKGIETELKRLVKSSFELRFSNSHKHIFQHGPFLKSNFVLKDFFLDKLDASYPVEVSFLEIGNYQFLSLVQTIVHEKERHQHLISLSSEQADHYQLVSGLSEQAMKFYQELMQSFFGEIEFFSDYQNVFKIQDYMKDRKDLMLYDVLINEKIVLEERAVYARELRTQMFEKLKMCERDPILFPACKQMMTDAKQALKYFNDKYPDHWSEDIFAEEKKVVPKKSPKKTTKRRK